MKSFSFCLPSFLIDLFTLSQIQLCIFFLYLFKDVVSLSSGLNGSNEKSTVILIFVSQYIICLFLL